MNTKIIIRLVALLAGVMVMAGFTQIAYAMNGIVLREQTASIKYQLATQSPIQTAAPTSQNSETPESREMPPIGNNALLVFGASVLVLIIIGGVLISSRLKSKH
jgi:hypothetical protein